MVFAVIIIIIIIRPNVRLHRINHMCVCRWGSRLKLVTTPSAMCCNSLLSFMRFGVKLNEPSVSLDRSQCALGTFSFHCESKKGGTTQKFVCNFVNCRPSFKVFSAIESGGSLLEQFQYSSLLVILVHSF
jgi:hypothetical protein